MKNSYRYSVLSLCGMLLLSGCSGAKETLGLNKKAPDEFKVLKHAPLALPPDYALRPPRPGAPRPQEQTTSEQAAQTVFGAAPQTAQEKPSDAAGVLLEQAGAGLVDPAIRQTIDQETSVLNQTNKSVAQKLLKLGGGDDHTSASIVDATKEAERLQQNAKDGKSPTEGETPTIEE